MLIKQLRLIQQYTVNERGWKKHIEIIRILTRYVSRKQKKMIEIVYAKLRISVELER